MPEYVDQEPLASKLPLARVGDFTKVLSLKIGREELSRWFDQGTNSKEIIKAFAPLRNCYTNLFSGHATAIEWRNVVEKPTRYHFKKDLLIRRPLRNS